MDRVFFNDEEEAVLEELAAYPQQQKLQILQASESSEQDPGTRRLLHALFLKLSGAQPQ